MAAIAKYKAVKEFEFENVQYGIGMVLILDPRDARELVESGKVLHMRYLDPADPIDQAEIERFSDNPTGVPKPKPVEEEISDEDAREETSDADSSEEDTEDASKQGDDQYNTDADTGNSSAPEKGAAKKTAKKPKRRR